MKRVLVIAAHPDDDILGCGGIFAKYSSDPEIEFRVIFVTEGSSCRYDIEEIGSEEVIKTIEKRNSCGVKALKTFGITNYRFYNLPCGRLDTKPIIEINKIIEEEIEAYRPDTVFTHSYDDTNNDHIIVHRATQMATRPGAKIFVGKVYSYEVLSSSEWRFTKVFKPNFFETLSKEDVLLKWKALAEYESETKPFPYPRSLEGVETLAKYRGLQAGKEFAEAFCLIREIN